MAFKKILCAVDFSNESIEGLKRAIDLARQSSSARLFILHALEAQPVFSQYLPPEGLGEITVELQEKAHESMEQLVEQFKSKLKDLNFKTQVSSGRGFEEILENANVWGADLIVVGSHGSAGLDQVVLGSTTGRVLERAPCSVLIVRPPQESVK
ncbi:MAG TPA: universal stress protein [Acidobacteriota bacterium]|nr:universal stress protein [Acidobacteriota bacterium]